MDHLYFYDFKCQYLLFNLYKIKHTQKQNSFLFDLVIIKKFSWKREITEKKHDILKKFYN